MMGHLGAAQGSLFEPSGPPVLARSSAWVEGVLLGEGAIALCSIAVALVGVLMLSGRLPVLGSARVVLGCFVLLGAPLLAGEFLDATGASTAEPMAVEVIERSGQAPRQELAPQDHDPYSGASLRRN